MINEGAGMNYRLANESDMGVISDIVKSAIAEMERNNIFQWDDVYPTKDDFLDDIKNRQLFVGILDGDISVVYAINKEYDEQYNNGNWKYPNCEYRIIHRLCVNPRYQNRGIAKNTLTHIENELRRSGIETIRLDVYCNNSFALSLYHNNGYEKAGIAEWRKGTFFLMEKHL